LEWVAPVRSGSIGIVAAIAKGMFVALLTYGYLVGRITVKGLGDIGRLGPRRIHRPADPVDGDIFVEPVMTTVDLLLVLVVFDLPVE
jgi:hypothetical protein